MACFSERLETFFRLSPVEGHAGKGAAWYAIQRGSISRRIDAYSNQPHFRELFRRIHSTRYRVKTLSSLAERIFSGTTPLAKSDAYVEPPNGIRFLRSGEITMDGGVRESSELHISEAVHTGVMRRSELMPGDLLIAIVGATIGSVGIYSRDEPANINQAIAAVRLSAKDVSSEFACWYLHSSLGQQLLDFFKRPVARANINLEEIGEIPLIVPSETKQAQIVAAMNGARAERRAKLAEADALLAGIDGFLLQALHLTPPPKDDRRVFAVLSGLIRTRFDPHFHLPAFAQNARMLADSGSQALGSMVSFSNEIWKPRSHRTSTFRYIEISDVNTATGEARAEEIPVVEAPSRARMAVRERDIIVSLTRPHHGAIAQITPDLDGCVASTGFSVLRGVDERRVSRDYLWCFLRSEMCLSQMLQRASGGNYPAITEAELARVLVPVPDHAVQEAIAAEAGRRGQEARRLHDEGEARWQAAKRWFEQQLLGGAQP